MNRHLFALAMLSSLLQACARPVAHEGQSTQSIVTVAGVGEEPAEDSFVLLDNVPASISGIMSVDGGSTLAYDFPEKNSRILVEMVDSGRGRRTAVSLEIDGTVTVLSKTMPWREALEKAFKSVGCDVSQVSVGTIQIHNPKRPAEERK